MENTPPKLLTLGQMATYLGVSRNWLRREADQGSVPALNADGRFLFDPITVENLLQARAREWMDEEPYRLYGIVAMARELHMPTNELKLLAQTRQIPCYVVGNTYAFDPPMVHQALAQRPRRERGKL